MASDAPDAPGRPRPTLLAGLEEEASEPDLRAGREPRPFLVEHAGLVLGARPGPAVPDGQSLVAQLTEGHAHDQPLGVIVAVVAAEELDGLAGQGDVAPAVAPVIGCRDRLSPTRWTSGPGV